MGESNKHKVLVEYALRFIKDSVGEELSYFIETDINDGRPLPQLTMEGYRPDVFFEYNGVMFIGEAKTSDDILREHSINQYYSYLKKCSLNQGHATFVWQFLLKTGPGQIIFLEKSRKKYLGIMK